MQKVVLPNSVEQIYPYAFFRCKNLEEIVIGENVKEMMLGTFNDCGKLKKVTILSNYEIEAWATDYYQTFSRCTSLESIYVKKDLINYYQTTSPWNEYYEKYKIIQ